MDALELEYRGPFRAMKAGSRGTNKSRTFASWPRAELSGFALVHPAVLDVSLQSTFAALYPPGSIRLRSPMLPVAIERVVVRPRPLLQYQEKGRQEEGRDELTAKAHAEMAWSSFQPVGDVSVCIDGRSEPEVVAHGIRFRGFEEPSPANDTDLFYKTLWQPDVTSVSIPTVDADAHKVEALQRMALFQVRCFVEGLQQGEPGSFRWHHQRMAGYYMRLLRDVKDGRRSDIPSSWLQDREEHIEELYGHWQHVIDARLATAVGRNLLAVCRGKRDMLEVMMEDGKLF
ncbi:hypothetical protein MPH_03441 [Macrophomina phaseolina MS6]|uniref:PKS/mFAS DH domain-containing protein n=1 Tax=Macrophomina phaseolina (strain MS6) TaxID=1126212 RepID=K2S3J4_MACPH|nr:hypothetical protein MPH_03441 [Macrophomina phaseolina MS6]